MPFVPGIKELIASYPSKVEVPVDLGVDEGGKRKEISVANLPTNYPIYDIGVNTIKKYSEIISKAKSIVISGPMGVYENKEFLKGTKSIFEAVTSSKAFSLAGGGHTIGALEEFGLAKKMGYVSTAGGALIEFLMGEQLPGVVALEKAVARA
jgi:phosphoglycerate kinase